MTPLLTLSADHTPADVLKAAAPRLRQLEAAGAPGYICITREGGNRFRKDASRPFTLWYTTEMPKYRTHGYRGIVYLRPASTPTTRA